MTNAGGGPRKGRQQNPHQLISGPPVTHKRLLETGVGPRQSHHLALARARKRRLAGR